MRGQVAERKMVAKAVVTPTPKVKARAGRVVKRGAGTRVETLAAVAEATPVVSKYRREVSSLSKISSKGQLTLPMQVRERLGVKAGDEVEFFFDGERTVVKPVRKVNPDIFDRWVGAWKENAPEGFDAVAWQREIRGYDAWDEEHLGK